MERKIEDTEYMECLTTLYRRNYLRWRDKMLSQIEDIVCDFEVMTVDQVMEKYALTPRDVALLVRLHYFTPEEAQRFDLERIEQAVPL